MYVLAHVFMNECMYEYMHLCICAFMRAYYVFEYAFICVCIYVCLYTGSLRLFANRYTNAELTR